VQEVFETCLGRVPDADMLVCVNLDSDALLGVAQLGADSDHAEASRLASAAAALFQGEVIAPEQDGGADGPITEAVIAGEDTARIFLRFKNRQDAAIAYRIGRHADLGMALATSRRTLAELEDAL